MKYIDGFVFVVPKNKVSEYKKMASIGRNAWKKHGALEYFECIGDDLNPKWIKFTFPKMTKLKKGETVWFSFIIFKSKAHRNEVNKKVMNEMNKEMEKYENKMPFDMKRMAYGGFQSLVEF